VIGNVIVFHHSALQFSQCGVLMILAMECTYFWCKKKEKRIESSAFMLPELEFFNVLYTLFTPYISFFFNCFIVNVNLQLMLVHCSIDSD